MRDMDNLCLNCFEELTDGAVCENCGYDNETVCDSMYLESKTILADKYVVGAFTKHESDAVSYMGYDTHLDKAVIIREFFPKGIANRLEGSKELHVRQKFINLATEYRNTFYNLWTTLEKLHSFSATVPVYDVFEENGTVYAIIEKMDSIPLREYLLRNSDGYIQWENARLMFMPVLTTIEAMHENGIIHGSITPDSLVLCRDGKVRLAPFTISDACDASSELEFNVNDGYTALEQYENNHEMCNASDIYAFSACIYRALVGTNPPDAPSREANDKLMIPNSIAETIPMHVIKAMGRGLQIYPEKRVKSISDFREFLDAAPTVQAKSAPVKEESYSAEDNYGYGPASETKKNTKAKAAIIALVIFIVAAIGAGVYLVNFTDYFNTQEEPTTEFVLQNYEVPNFVNVGYTQSDIEKNAAWNEQFTLKFIAEYSMDVEAGQIFAQSIEAGETVEAGTEIILTVSKGIQTETVPDVSGKTFDEAKAELEKLGFKVSSVEVYNDENHTPKTVKDTYGMAPAAGSQVAVGEEIILQVYGDVVTTTTTTTTTPAN